MKVETVETITINMSIQEAQWLKSAMQNPLSSINENSETTEQYIMRHKFFNALKDGLEINNV